MKWRFVDLTIPLESSSSEPEPVLIEWISHREGAVILTKNTSLSPDDFPAGLALNLERIKLTSHSGTHVDAPIHYGPTTGGIKAKTIDEIPIEWFFGNACLLDCARATEEPVSLKEIHDTLSVNNLSLEPMDLVLIYTGADRLWGRPEYFTHFRGMSVGATRWLLDQEIKVIGIDSFGFDPPFERMIRAAGSNKEALWPCHMLGRDFEYCQIERLANLSMLPRDRKFLFSCFPLKLTGCGAAPARAVALI